MRYSRLRYWVVGVATLLLAALVSWNVIYKKPEPPKAMNLERIVELQILADQSCTCARGSASNTQKHRNCWNDFEAATKPYDNIRGPEAVPTCVGWDADDTITFGPSVAKRREKQQRYNQFMNNLTEKQKLEGYTEPSEFITNTDGEISSEAPEWTVTTRRIHGGCSAKEEKNLAKAKKSARERTIVSEPQVEQNC